MPTIKITCLTDLKNSTALNEHGQSQFHNRRMEFLNVGQIFCEMAGGRFIKNTGDGHLMEFSEINSAIYASTQLQQYYKTQPCSNRETFGIRIGLFLGLVIEDKNDIFGSGVNQAARLEAQTLEGEIWVNGDLVKHLKIDWGRKKIKQFFNNLGKFKFKGISTKVEIYSFNWQDFSKNNPQTCLQNLVFKHLQESKVVLTNLFIEDINKPSYIIWPVVPRDMVNAIHRAQLEMIRLLTLLGWKIIVIVVDCGTITIPTKDYTEQFIAQIKTYGTSRGMDISDIKIMSDLYTPKCQGCDVLHTFFQRVITDLTLDNMLDINNKKYSDTEQIKIRKAATLDFLKPALVISAVLYLQAKMQGKCILIVGYDEKTQWERVLDIPKSRAKIGILFNPVLYSFKGIQEKQTRNWPYWDSWEAMSNEMKEFNLASWALELLMYLPAFPRKMIKFSSTEYSAKSFINEDELNKNFSDTKNSTELAKYLFEEGIMKNYH